MKRIILLSLSCCVALCTYGQSVPATWKAKERYAFVENKGQIRDQNGQQRPDIQFRLQSPEVTVTVGNAALHYQWQQTEPLATRDLAVLSRKTASTYRMDVTLLGADPGAPVIKEGQQRFYEKYYLEHLGLRGTIAHAYEKMTYRNVYPGIDWVLYVNHDETGKESVKYDFIVHPGADPAQIKLQYSGATRLELAEDGSLLATTPMGTIKEQAPYSYTLAQENSGTRTKVDSRFELQGNVLRFRTAGYKGTLVIDPSLEWATYYGGGGFDLGTVLTCDYSGNVYLTGASWMGTDIATTGSHQFTNAGDFDAFLVKFDTDGNRLWATYYGGASVDYGFGVVCDVNNRIYLSGITQSASGIATAGSFQTSYSGDGDNYLAKFDSDGGLMWATYYGSAQAEYNGLCATDNMGYIYLAGITSSPGNMATNGFQDTYGGGANDAYLVKFDTMGLRQWATYYGGSGDDQGDGVTCDGFGNVYLAGHTNSTSGIATPGSHQPALGGGIDNFLVKFNGAGARQWATYYGGTGRDININMSCVTTDKNGNVFLSGHTDSPDGIATAGSYQQVIGGAEDGFLVKFNGAGVRSWATYFGSYGTEYNGGIACDFSNNVFWTGLTQSAIDIVTPDAYQDAFGGFSDAYLARFTNDGVLEYSTYYGGNTRDEGIAIAIDNIGNAYISGGTESATNIATPGSFLSTYGGGIAAFVAKFCTSVTSNAINGPDTVCANSNCIYSVPALAGATGYIWTIPAGWEGESDSANIHVVTNGTGGMITVQAIRCDTSAPQMLNIYVRPEVPAVIVANGSVLSTVNVHSTYQWLFNGNIIPGAVNPTYTATQNGAFSVAVTNNPGNCTDTSAVLDLTGVVGISGPVLHVDAISIYPNPASDVLHINAGSPVTVKLSSMEGKVWLQESDVKVIDISNLAAGVYLLQFTDLKGNYIGVKRFTKFENR
jgi:hypothetical protein